MAANAWRIYEHQGSQIDGPNHFAPGGAGLDARGPLDLLIPIGVLDSAPGRRLIVTCS